MVPTKRSGSQRGELRIFLDWRHPKSPKSQNPAPILELWEQDPPIPSILSLFQQWGPPSRDPYHLPATAAGSRQLIINYQL